MGAGRGPQQAGLLLLQGSPRPWGPLPLRGLWCGQLSQGLAWARPAKPPGPRLIRDIAQGEDALPLPSGATSPFPPTMSGRQRQPHSCYGNPGLQAAAGSAGKEGSSTPGAGGCQEAGGGDLRRGNLGSGVTDRGQGASLTARTGKAPKPPVGHFTWVQTSDVSSVGPGDGQRNIGLGSEV